MATEMLWNKNWGSLSSPHTSEIHRPKSYRKAVADSLIGPRSRPRSAWNHSESAKLRISPLCERLPSPPHSQDPHGEINVRVSRGANYCHDSRPTSRTCRLQKESAWDHLVSYRLGVPSQSLATGTPAAAKARATRSFSMWYLDDLPAACLHTLLCRPRASTGEPHRQRCDTRVQTKT